MLYLERFIFPDIEHDTTMVVLTKGISKEHFVKEED